MVRQIQKRIVFLISALAVLCPLSAKAQNDSQQDSLVRLLKAAYIEQSTEFDVTRRKTKDATFLHNGTYLICDSAIWFINENYIEARGNVRLEQGDTELTSDALTYYTDRSVAEFRGPLVQLKDKEGNTLRTRSLDYNTRDSIATFFNGAAMKDNEGQVMESVDGNYFSTKSLFTFRNKVEMYTDSVLVKTELMDYDTDSNTAYFKSPIDFWKEGNMLSAGGGKYMRNEELFFFTPGVHATTENQEVWCDSLYFYRIPQDVKMLGTVQVQDTTRGTFALAEYMFYQDSVSKITMCDHAAVAMKTEQNSVVDTLYFGADTLIYNTVQRYKVDSILVLQAEDRLKDMNNDPVSRYRADAAAKAAAALKEKMQQREDQTGIKPPKIKRRRDAADNPETGPTSGEEASDSTTVQKDSLAAETDTLSLSDPLEQPVDTVGTVPQPADTTGIGFLYGRGSVKVFRKDLQAVCDSIRYSDLDSIARLFKDPMVWNEGVRQYSSDSIFVLVRGGGLDRASLQSDAFIIIREEEDCYDQIRSSEVMAYFDESSNLKRFDALGNATALFYLQEDSVFATVNKVESKLLSALFADGEIKSVRYFDAPKNNAYPLAQMKKDDRYFKGFNWNAELKPSGREDITPLVIRPSQRSLYGSRQRPSFPYSEQYFAGYMSAILSGQVFDNPSEGNVSRDGRRAHGRFIEGNESDQQIAVVDDDNLTGNADPDVPEAADSLATASLKDTLKTVPSDSTLAVLADTTALTAKALKQAEKEARWAELDARDAQKAARKAEKKLLRKRKKTLRFLMARDIQERKDAEKLRQYIRKYQSKHEE